jgi:outer membrane protein, multidrug efflux system
MSARRSLRAAACAGVLTLLAGCMTVGPDYERPPVTLPAAYPGVAAVVEPPPAIAADWWVLFGDSRLSRLVERALLANADVAQAVARVEQTSGALGEASRTQLRGTGTVRGGSFGSGTSTSERDLFVTLTAAYEIDFWGRLRRNTEAANAQYLASTAARDTVRLTVASLVAQAWFEVLSLDAQAASLRVTLQAQQDSVRIIGQRLQGGTVSRLDLEQAELQRSDVALQLRELQRQRALAESTLGLLTAEPGLVVPAGDAAGVSTLPAPPVLPPGGLPSSLLERRPDVVRAEQLLAASNAQIGVARAAMFPQITLNGTLGGESVELGQLLENPNRFWALGVGLSLPIFDQGRLASRVEQAGARQREAVAAYQEAVGAAFKDVADALANGAAASESQAEVAQRERTAQRALVLAQARFDAGYSGYLELLEARRTATSAQQAGVRNRQLQLNASVELIKALGGGWGGLPAK